MAQQAWHRPVLPAHYLPNTREETGSTRRLYNLAKVFGVDQPAALQMSAKEAPCANAWEEATLLVEWALTPRGHSSPCDWYAKVTASTIQWANLCLETAFPFCCPPWQTKSCSEHLTLRVRSTYMRNALTGHSNAKAGSASSEGSACRFTTWSRKGVVGTLGTYPGRGLKTTWE